MAFWTLADIPDQRGRTVIVTGANSGLGLVTATELAARGAAVVLAVRNVEAGEAVARSMPASADGTEVSVRRLDLASLASIHEFADAVRAHHPRIDLLVNNAGAENLGARRETADGFEFHLSTNMLGHFALTGLLLPVISSVPGSRIVSLSSITHKRAHLDFDDLQSDRDFTPGRAYGASKLATTVFGLELDRRLRRVGSPTSSVIAHPGLSRSNFIESAWKDRGIVGRTMGRIFSAVATQPVEQGTLPQLHAATARDVRGGDFFGPDGRGERRGRVSAVRPSAEAADPAVGRRLWEHAQRLTAIKYL